MRSAPALPILLLLLAVATPAVAAELVISTGREGGSYHAIGQRLRTTLPERDVDVVTSPGSLENLLRLDDPESKVGIALTQADALVLYLAEHPDFADEFFLLGDVGEECVLLVTAAGEKPLGVADLKKPGVGSVVVDDVGSGAAVTLDHLGRLEPAFRNARPAHEDTLEGLLQLTARGGFSTVEGVMIVQRPSRISPPIEMLMTYRDRFRLAPIRESDVPNAKLPDGSPVYTFERATLGGERHHLKMGVETLCMRAFLLGSKTKLSKELRKEAARSMAESRGYIVGLER